ncbi:PecA family PE domain-processing aspartic protease [Mycolicibacterium sp.]|uniref:PecA family PE domain-processing aspartic protease n=1 Tax=Mycolicibacterium sp. TaxID=2320850 RepID=UPI001A31C33D|nr:PecA family PE domain-processing aspartic protease [Mycolicibacterium sp.]MBJ7401439.1 PecA family PE domain-processing aspartic protease [Mycolicibacterium sp.]
MAKHRRIAPYAWLGAGAVTLGMGAALVAGTAVAVADIGSGVTDGSASSASASSGPSNDAAAPTHTRPASRVARVSPRDSGAPSASMRKNRVLAPFGFADAVVTLPAASAPASTPASLISIPASTPAQTETRRAVRVHSIGSQQAASVHSASALPAAAPPGPGVNPSYNMQSYLPTEPIVAGTHVTLALGEISDAQTLLNQETWGSGRIAAGVASIVPQLFLAEAAWSLSAWQSNMPNASQAVAQTVGIPIIHQLIQVNLLATMALPTLAEAGLSGAVLLLPLVNLFGAATAAAQSQLAQARSNGMVYAVVPVQMRSITEPVVSVSVNNGPGTAVLVDTGSSGLLVTRDSATGDLGPAVATGQVTFSGSPTTFHYTTHLTTVDFGGGAVSTPTAVNVVDEADAAAFRTFVAGNGVAGILGVGANTYGPGPVGYTIPTASLPGELSDGFLLYQGALLGLFGVMVLGPDPLATRVSVPGAPDAYVKVSVDDEPQQIAYSIIDSGGVYGTLPAYLINGASSVPVGTKISVYTADGQTLLYTYLTSGSNTPTVVGDGSLMNTGYIPFQQGPVYINYSAPDRIGSTDFAIW